MRSFSIWPWASPKVAPHGVGLRPGVGQLGAQGLDLTVRLRQLAADGCRLRVRLRQVRALRFGLGLGFGEVGQQDVGLRLHFGQRDRQPLAAFAFAAQLLVRRVERGLRVRARLFGRGVRRAQLLAQIRRFGARAVELAREAGGVGNRGVEEAAALGEVLFGRRPGARLLAHLGFGFEPLRVDVGVRLDGGVEIAVERLGPLGFFLKLVPQRLGLALDVGQRARQPLVLGALRVEVLLDHLERRLGLLLDFLGGDLRGRAGGRIQPANQLLDVLVGSWRAGSGVLYASRGGVERVAKTAELLDGCLCLAGQQPAEQGGRFLCGVVAEFHRVRLSGEDLRTLQPWDRARLAQTRAFLRIGVIDS